MNVNRCGCKSRFFVIQSNSPAGAMGLKALFTVKKKKKKAKTQKPRSGIFVKHIHLQLVSVL